MKGPSSDVASAEPPPDPRCDQPEHAAAGQKPSPPSSKKPPSPAKHARGAGNDSSVVSVTSRSVANENHPKSRATVLDMHGYKVGKNLGHGSYATVKEAYSVKHLCKVAIKIISKKKAPADYLEKFLPREIDVVKLLKHPSLVVFLQSIETNNRVYLIMEHVSNGDLLEVIRAKKIIKESQSCVWFQQIIAGIDYCHQKGVVHRDLKCENVLLDEFNNMKITDFGFAKAGMKPRSNGDFALSETYCGSYAYAPPEILTGTPYVPQLADIWSAGVILYVMVFGRLPFDDSNHKKLLRQIHRGPSFPENRDVSNECKDMILRVLVKRESRIKIHQIRKHHWLLRQAVEAKKAAMKSASTKRVSDAADPVASTEDKSSAVASTTHDQVLLKAASVPVS